MKHAILHILGCLLPIALLFLLPALGVGSNVTYLIFIVLMIACHIFMMDSHQHGTEEARVQDDPKAPSD